MFPAMGGLTSSWICPTTWRWSTRSNLAGQAQGAKRREGRGLRSPGFRASRDRIRAQQSGPTFLSTGGNRSLVQGGVEIRLSYIVVNYYNHLQIVVPPLLHRQRCLEASFWLDLLLVWIFWTLDRRPSNPRRDLPLVEANRAKRPKADIPPALTNVCFRGQSRHDAGTGQCPLMTQSGHSRVPFNPVTTVLAGSAP